MIAKRIDEETLLVPVQARDEETGIIGDGWVEVKKGTPLYEQWHSFVDAKGEK